ncbi:sodium:solute symporter family protein [Carboxydothermus pertinax]|uniref:Sodium:solute symporter n=1 Tax=Carboxydothermus pertinax TaxID=870242 RepID=A0A1L8CVH0_9THEO|nr:sodium:solute symporter [Carboxydothermus pertinax]GAV22864.1 sodium:solute symporter [Carboxydothermus pertinax]
MVKLWFLGIFVFIMLFAGFIGFRKTKTVDDFILGGRKVGPWLSAFAYGTTYFSAVLFIGYAGKVGFSFGLPALWIAIGNAVIGSFLAWKVLAKPTRQMTQQLNVRTMPEFLAKRYDLPLYKPLAALIIFVFLVPYSASVYMGLSYLFEAVFGLPYLFALLLMAGLTAIYLLLGGYFAVALTDFIQGIIMLGGVFLMVIYLVKAPEVGGFANIYHKLSAINPDFTSLFGGQGVSSLLFLMLLTSFGSWGLPQMVQKFYAIRDEKAIMPATWVSTFFALVIAGGAYFTGALTPLFFKSLPVDPATGKPTPDLLVPQLIAHHLPEWVGALILLLVLSASMSTLSSLVLVSSSAVAVDLLGENKFFKDKGSYQVLALRLLTVLFIFLSVIIALFKPAIILSLMAISWGAVSGSFFAPYFYGLFFRRVSAAGAVAGTLTGLLTVLILAINHGFDAKILPVVGVYGIFLPFLVVPLVSFLVPAKESSTVKLLFEEQ